MALLDLLRNLLGESADLEAAHDRLMELEDEVIDLREQLRSERYLRRLLTEPGDPPCEKIRLQSRELAVAMVADVLAECGDHVEPYICPLCPPQPLGRGGYWHVRNAKRSRRGFRGRAVRKERGRHPMTQRLDLTPSLPDRTDADSAVAG